MLGQGEDVANLQALLLLLFERGAVFLEDDLPDEVAHFILGDDAVTIEVKVLEEALESLSCDLCLAHVGKDKHDKLQCFFLVQVPTVVLIISAPYLVDNVVDNVVFELVVLVRTLHIISIK